jgi:hypothetical protein
MKQDKHNVGAASKREAKDVFARARIIRWCGHCLVMYIGYYKCSLCIFGVPVKNVFDRLKKSLC